MKPIHVLAATALAAALSACGTTMSNTQTSGYLSSYEGLQTSEANSFAGTRATVAIDPTQVSVADISWRVADGHGVSAAEQQELMSFLRGELVQRVRALPAQAGGRPAQLRAAITRVETVSPVLNTLGTLLLIGPLDRGGVAVEIEAVDPATGNQLAGLRLGYFAPLTDIGARFSKMAPAQVAVTKAALDFAQLLAPAPAARTGSL